MADPPRRIADDFDGPVLDRELWETLQILPGQYDFRAPGRASGKEGDDGDGKAIVFTARLHETTICGSEICQRLEIRESDRVNFGDEVWYSFSFRVEGDIIRHGSYRWVIGQWKEEADVSPFIAQRFDDGIFHITIEDEGRRKVIASAKDDQVQLAEFHASLKRLQPGQARSAITAARRTEEKRTVAGTTGIEQRPAELVHEFRYLSDIEKYTGDARVLIEPGEQALLPDPAKGWVDMVYRIRASTEGDSLVQVWANGKLVVTVRGYIGHKEAKGPTQYFKTGHYRMAVPGETRLWFDRFRRAPTREEL